MSPRYAVYGVCALLAALALAWGIGDWQQGKGEAGEHNAAVASGEAVTYETQAQAQNPVIQKLEAQHAQDAANLDRLSRERDALLKRLAAVPRPSADPSGGNVSPVQPVGSDDSALEAAEAVIAKDAEVIEALEAKSVTQDAEIAAFSKKADEWEAACHARERQALAQEAATRAWKDAVMTSRWKGRIEGFAAGVALGYVGGRR